MSTLALEPIASRPLRLASLALGVTASALVRWLANGDSTLIAFAAGTGFGVALLLLAAFSGWRAARPRTGPILIGLGGGAMLLLLPRLLHSGPFIPIGIRPSPFAVWVAVTALVGIAEEVVFRGSLLDLLAERAGLPGAVTLSSLAFALVHVPLYGWGVVPLDAAVGVWFAGLRLAAGSVAAPAAAHVLADLATWWL